MGLPRQEVNFRRLLARCELMIKNKQQDDEQFTKYISSLCSMLNELKEIGSDSISDYTRRINAIKKQFNYNDSVNSETTEKSDGYNIPKSVSTDVSNRRELLGTENNLRLRKGNDDLDEVLDYHKGMQEKIANDMLQLTRSLKEQSQVANRIIKQDTELVSKSANLTDKNFSKLKVESEKLTEHTKRACKCWMWVMLIIVMVLFINMVLFMKVMKKKI